MPHEPQRGVLDAAALELFARKGKEAGPGIAQVGHGNAVKVRRVLQIVQDLCSRPLSELRVLDLACGEGVYAIETALHGAEVVGIDGRTERMQDGVAIAARHGLDNVRFEQDDVRRISRATHGDFDVVYLLGILYHLAAEDVLAVLRNAAGMSREMVVIDTHCALAGRHEAHLDGRVYRGAGFREHAEGDPESLRRERLQMSLDNPLSFRFDLQSLVRLLIHAGFTSVFECRAPLEALKPADRVTLVATTGSAVRVATYPWINDKLEEEIAASLRRLEPDLELPPVHAGKGIKGFIKGLVNGALRPLGIEVRRI